jgi:hypothetical protein
MRPIAASQVHRACSCCLAASICSARSARSSRNRLEVSAQPHPTPDRHGSKNRLRQQLYLLPGIRYQQDVPHSTFLPLHQCGLDNIHKCMLQRCFAIALCTWCARHIEPVGG